MTRSDPTLEGPTANERFKRGFASWFWGGLILATLIHLVLFVTAPTFSTQDVAFSAGELAVLELPNEIQLPPPPEAIPRPSAPVIVEAAEETDQTLTIPPTTFETYPVEALPAPPKAIREEKDLAAAPVFTPMTVRPTLKNGPQVAEALLRFYPRLLRDAGIGGTVTVWFFINEDGRVMKTQVNQSSGYDAFDDAALLVADMMRFTPAYNRDKRVPVWVSIPILFEIAP